MFGHWRGSNHVHRSAGAWVRDLLTGNGSGGGGRGLPPILAPPQIINPFANELTKPVRFVRGLGTACSGVIEAAAAVGGELNFAVGEVWGVLGRGAVLKGASH